jgi:hypothetical protein
MCDNRERAAGSAAPACCAFPIIAIGSGDRIGTMTIDTGLADLIARDAHDLREPLRLHAAVKLDDRGVPRLVAVTLTHNAGADLRRKENDGHEEKRG